MVLYKPSRAAPSSLAVRRGETLPVRLGPFTRALMPPWLERYAGRAGGDGPGPGPAVGEIVDGAGVGGSDQLKAADV